MHRLFMIAFRNDSGATAIEYALIAGMVGMMIVIAAGLVGNELLATFTELATLL